MTTVYITQGLPASGKSTWARTLDALRFNMDETRAMLWGDTPWTKENEHIAFNVMIEGAKQAIAAGRDVVIDNTHVSPGWPKRYKKEFGQLDVTFVVQSFMDVSVEACIARDEFRTPRVGADVINKLKNNYDEARAKGWKLTDKWMNGEKWVKPEPYVNDPTLQPVVLCDLDGTVAINDGHRNHYDYTKVLQDKPNWPIIDLVQEIQDMTKVIFVSGRKDNCYSDTRDWLGVYNLWRDDSKLIMRNSDDNRPDYVIKGELFDKHIRGRYDVRFCLDDRNQVVRGYRDMGLTVLQVNDGAF